MTLDARRFLLESGLMLELQAAQENILSRIEPLTAQTVAIAEAFGRYAAESVHARINLPPFDNSAMDGYAVRSADVASASSASPVLLTVTNRVAAGQHLADEVTAGTCIRIFTGSPLPAGADAVVMQEDSRPHSDYLDRVWITDSVKPWESVRFKGEDIKEGAVIVSGGQKVNLGKLNLLAATGVSDIQAVRNPTIGLLATGTELLEPGAPLVPGKIYESNKVGLSPLLKFAGALPRAYPLVTDSLDSTIAALSKAFDECDAVITTGGVSVGEFDFVKAAFEKLGGSLEFWRVNIKPGKPFVFGRLGTKFLFGLPGNPVSALVTYFLLVQPAILRMQGASDCSLPTVPAVLNEPLSNPGDRPHFMRVFMDASGQVRSAGTQASHVLSAMANANGLVEVPAKTTLAAGTGVKVLRWE